MKTLKLLIAGLVICSATFITSCKKDSPATTTTTTTPSLSNKLAFTVKDAAGTLVTGATVKEYSNSAKISADNVGTTDSNGSVTFSNFAAGTTYYYNVDATVNGVSKHQEGSVAAQQNSTVTTTVQFGN